MRPRSTVVAVFAHPDDESIAAGGALARFAAEGLRTVVVTCTSGGAGPWRAPSPSPDAAGEGPYPDHSQPARSLADVRDEELRQALAVLGVARGVQLGYGDSGFPERVPGACFAGAALDEAAGAIAGVLREERPDTILTHDADGGYGHPDHVRAHQATVLARRLAAPAAELYAVVFPRAVLLRFAELMSAPMSGLMGIEDMDPPPDFGTPDQLVTDALDVSAYVEAKRAAIAAHRSQVGDDHVLVRMPPEVRRELWASEHFRFIDR